MHQIEQRPALLDEMISVPNKLREFTDKDGQVWYEVKPHRFVFVHLGSRAKAESIFAYSSWRAWGEDEMVLTYGPGTFSEV